MLHTFVCLFAVFATVFAGELSILHAPRGLQFKGKSKLDQSLLNEVFLASLGFTTEQHSDWPCLYITDPFNLPKCLVTVTIDGLDRLDTKLGLKVHHSYPIVEDEDMFSTWASLSNRFSERYSYDNATLVNLELLSGSDGYEQLFGHLISLPIKHTQQSLKPRTHNEDKDFLKELGFMAALTDKVSSLPRDSEPDIFFLHFTSLTPLIKLHGPDSPAVKQALHMLGARLEALESMFTTVYEGEVLFSVITSNNIVFRKPRSLLEDPTEEDTDENPLNLSKVYSPHYPVMFNIILWFGVAFLFSLISIAYAIGYMDPGRDSIIYRMTSTRIKKDN